MFRYLAVSSAAVVGLLAVATAPAEWAEDRHLEVLEPLHGSGNAPPALAEAALPPPRRTGLWPPRL